MCMCGRAHSHACECAGLIGLIIEGEELGKD